MNKVVNSAKYLFSLSVYIFMYTLQIGYYYNVYQCADKADSVYPRIQDSSQIAPLPEHDIEKKAT